MWGFMKRMLGGDEKPSQTTEEGERSDIRRPGGLPGGNGESRVADTPAASPAATPVMGDDDHLGKAAVARQAARQAIKDKRYDDAWRYLHGVVCGRGRNPTLRLWPTIFSGKIDVFPGDRRSRLISSMTSVAPA